MNLIKWFCFAKKLLMVWQAEKERKLILACNTYVKLKSQKLQSGFEKFCTKKKKNKIIILIA